MQSLRTQSGTSRKRARESLGSAAGGRDAKMARRAVPVRRQSDAHAQAAPVGGGGVAAHTLTRPLRSVGRERSDSPHRAPSLAEAGVVAQRLFRTPTPPTQRSKHPAVVATRFAAGNVQRPRPSGLEDSDSSWYFAWRRREEQKYVAGVMLLVVVVLLLLTAWGFSCAAPAAPVPRVLQWWCWPRGRSAVRMRPRRELCIYALSGTVAAPMRMHDPLTPQSTAGGAWVRCRTVAGQLHGLLLWVSGCGRAVCLRAGGGACCVRVCMGGCACALCVCQSVWKRQVLKSVWGRAGAVGPSGAVCAKHNHPRQDVAVRRIQPGLRRDLSIPNSTPVLPQLGRTENGALQNGVCKEFV